jgi:prepilin-type N-terminal cleavage/methylation domain-containing protein
MNIFSRKILGFTLIEMMLVLVIASSLIVMMLNLSQVKMAQMRRERTAIQMQGILNAAASYYVSAGQWPPSNLVTLQSAGYLPATAYYSGWGDPITASVNSANGYTVSVVLSKLAASEQNTNAAIIAGMLPLGVATTNTVTGTINVPGQNLNNAMAVNFGALYYSGACVPAPTCPTGMTATIMVIPVSATGMVPNSITCTSPTDPTSCSSVGTNPITSFTAYYRGTSISNDAPVSGSPPSPADCEIMPAGGSATSTGVACQFGSNTYSSTDKYWRVCIAVATASGLSYPSSSDTYAYNEGKLTGSILAITRCMPAGGDLPAGSSGSGVNTVWTPNSGWHQ